MLQMMITDTTDQLFSNILRRLDQTFDQAEVFG